MRDIVVPAVMKSRIIPFLFCIALTACGNGLPVPTLKYDGMKGKVLSVKDSCFEAEYKFGEVHPGELLSVEKREFNSDGYLVKYGSYDEDGDMLYEGQNEFKGGICVKSTSRSKYRDAVSKSELVEKRKNYLKYKIDEDDIYYQEVTYEGLYERCINLEAGELLYELYHDDKGRVIDQKSYSGGEIAFRLTRVFDDKGLLVKQTSYYSSDSEETVTYTYPAFDKTGNWTTRVTYDSDGDPKEVVKREIVYR